MCGFCGVSSAGSLGWRRRDEACEIRICQSCHRPSYFEGESQYPGEKFGVDMKGLPPEIDVLYREARSCVTIQAHTAGAMVCRKILMNVAVRKGASEDLKFFQYVDYLDSNGYTPRDGKDWLSHIKDKGNEANHELPAISKEDAVDLLVLVELLLKIVFEVPERIRKYPAPKAP